MQTPTLRVRVQRKRVEAVDISSFELVSLGPEPLPYYEPGAHIDVDIGAGQVRQYSLCTPYDESRYLIGVKRDHKSRGGSQFMHACVQEGDVLSIGFPKNHFPITSDGERFILIAGGIGITPLLSMAMQLSSLGKDIELHYFVQSIQHAAFRDRLQNSPFASTVRYHLGHGPDDLAPILASIAGEPASQKYLYLCGPRPFMELVRKTTSTWPPNNVRFEYFGADSAAVATPNSASDSSFEVYAAASDITLQVQSTESIVQALRANGVHIDTSCEEGHCGTCMTEVLEGQPEHRDSFLTPDERAAGGRMLPCVSRSCSARLVLNL